MSGLRQEYFDAWFVTDLPVDEWPTNFGIVTAYNPDGRLMPDAVNREADTKLKRSLERSHLFHFRVTGGSRDGTHREPGFGIVTTDQIVIDNLSREFGQEAFFWVEDGEVYCLKVGEPTIHRIGRWSERQLRTSKGEHNIMTDNQNEEKDLVYGNAGDTLVFMPRESATELANLREALNASKTWGELKLRIGTERYEEIISPHFENFYEELNMDVELTLEQAMAEFQSRKTNKDLDIGERAPEDNDRFDSEFVYGLSDGDWPEWPAQEMLQWVPDEIQKQFGRVVFTRLNGDYLELDESKEAEIVAAFRKLRYRCERDDVLVGKASGTYR